MRSGLPVVFQNWRCKQGCLLGNLASPGRAKMVRKSKVVHFGIWNREPGPDFCRALVLIDGEKFAGDIEIDQDARDWETHGHSQNPAYENVVLHLFFRRGQRRFFTRTARKQGCDAGLSPLRRTSKQTEPSRDGALDETRARKLVEAAASFRLRRKCEVFQRAARLRGHEEALFEAIAAAMGFKNNKIPFLLVAQRSSLARAKMEDGEALLFGLSGFLNAGHFDLGDRDARGYLTVFGSSGGRSETESVASSFPRTLGPIPPFDRRIIPIVAWARSRPPPAPSRRSEGPSKEGKALISGIPSLDHPFWEKHSSLAGDLCRK